MNVRLIIPNLGNDLEHKDYFFQISRIAGGFTSWQGIRGWVGQNGRLIVEPITIVDFHIKTQQQKGLQSNNENVIRRLAKQIARDLVQNCVFLSIDGVVEYVEPN
jgi:hypothetical protein